MFLKIANVFQFIKFDSNDYDKIIKNIKKSNAFSVYADWNDKGEPLAVFNEEFNKYLDDKKDLHLFLTENEIFKEQDFLRVGTVYPGYGNQEKRRRYISELAKKYEIDFTEFSSRITTEPIGNGLSETRRYSISFEEEMFKNANVCCGKLEVSNHAFLNSNHMSSKSQRFALHSSIGRMNNGEKESIYAFATIYNTGIISLQLLVTFEHNRINESLGESPPNEIEFTEVDFYKLKKVYKKKDFWEREKRQNMNIPDIIRYYVDLLNLSSKNKFEIDDFSVFYNWILCNVSLNKKEPKDKEFMKDNIKYFGRFILNASKQYIDKENLTKLNARIQDSLIFEFNNIHFYSETSSVLYYGSTFSESVKQVLLNDETELKKDNIVLNEQEKTNHSRFIARELIIENMFDITYINELALTKRFFVKEVLNKISREKGKEISVYERVQKELRILEIGFDPETLFRCEGSPKKLYTDISRKLNSDELLKKARSFIENHKFEIERKYREKARQNENFVSLIVLILTAILSYPGIRHITFELFVQLPIIGYYISQRPLFTTGLLWSITMICIFISGLVRFFRNKIK